MPGSDGREKRVKITWQQFQRWQRWDEFPERQDDPPMTVDMTFWYNKNKYYLDSINHEFVILSDSWATIVSNKNFLSLLSEPIEEWSGKSFRDVIEEILFEN